MSQEEQLKKMNYRQRGYTDAWLQGKIEDAMSEGADAKRDFLNIWATDTHDELEEKYHETLSLQKQTDRRTP